jgi:hypothetical protein
MTDEGDAVEGRWRVAVQLLGALAGLVAIVTVAGGAVLMVRFSKLDLPADQLISVLPPRLLVVTGLHALVLPVAITLAAALPLFMLLRRGRSRRAQILLVLLMVAAVAVMLVTLPPSLTEAPVAWALVMLLVLACWVVAHRAIGSSEPAGERTFGSVATERLSLVLLATFVLLGTALSLIHVWEVPKLEPVAVLTDGTPSSVAGFYIGQTSDRVYIAPLPGGGAAGHPFPDADTDRIAEIRRDRVLALVLRKPAGTGDRASGRHQARQLLNDLSAATASTEPVSTADPVATFAPLVSLHADEQAMPMSADLFIAKSRLVRTIRGCTPLTVADVDPTRLAGPNAYRHRHFDERCRERADGPAISAADHTRPFDTKDRPAGLGEREGFALALDREWRPPRREPLREGGQSYLQRTPLYVEQHDEPSDDEPSAVRITYWLFYGLSQPPGPPSITRLLVHEGDWERISVLLREVATDIWQPLSVRYHFHDEHRDVPWSAVRTSGLDGGLHPWAYSALGSHATYWADGDYESLPKKPDGEPVRVPVYDRAMACGDCALWRTWEQVVDVRTRPWYGFGGAWGAIGRIGGTTGPLGPSTWKIRDPGNSPTDTVHRPLMPSPVEGAPPVQPPAAGG